MTNANPVGVPTFGARGLFGTNPLAFAVPAGREAPFVLDMATTVITNGKIEAYGNRDEPLPSGWAVDAQSRPATESREVPTGLLTGRNFILPLGGAGEDHGGHKGFNLAVLVDILSAALAGGVSGPDVRHHGQPYPGSLVSHFFGAIKIASFRDPAEFRSDMDRMLRRLRECPPAPGHDRVYYAGLKEFEHAEECRRLGVPVETPVFEGLATLAEDLQVRRPALDMK